ncbi:hypothetical protein Tco_0908349 [Tanacetum coccineum]|uniref:Xylulose kinase-1 n=1 Tax=Tanacetum coccineum TaxID=301880 RepID=A0ABQ5CTD6_9ASTR
MNTKKLCLLFLSKPTESDGFEQIVDFLNAHPIRYALTINPTIYISCIEQFWSTVMAKTINGEEQLHALVDGKKIIITESSVRRDLQLADEEGVDCLPNSTIFEQLTLMGKPKRKDTQVPQPSDPIENVVDEAVHKELGDSLVRAAKTVDDITLAQALEEMKSTKPKKKGVVIKELGESTTTISSQLSPQQSQGKDFRTELVKGKEKRARTELIQEITKKQKVEDNKEIAELKQLMEIIPDEEEVAIDAIPLVVKP